MTLSAASYFALASLLVWLALLQFRGAFWRADQHLPQPVELDSWPSVMAVVPARNEAKTVSDMASSLLAQNYPGAFSVVVVDDGSDDGTAEIARAANSDGNRLSVIQGKPLEGGWTGKLWAVAQGLEHTRKVSPDVDYILFTDADIRHDPENLKALVCKAEREKLDLVSLMALLRCHSFWERLLIPAFIFFFQKLYPFPWVNDLSNKMAAAAGGCLLVRRAALEHSGGVEAMRGRLIDDCAMASQIKKNGPIWLGLTESVHSMRAYDNLGEIRKMVIRTAFAQLNYSIMFMLLTVFAMILAYLAPPLSVLFGFIQGDRQALFVGLIAWMLMAAAFRPTLKLYKLPAWRGFLLPLAALLYTLMTVDSAIQHWRGRGGMWKGRSY